MTNYAELRKEYRQKRLLMGMPFVDNPPKKKSNIGWVIGALAVLLVGGCIASRPAHASISTYDAVHAIIGEAENQGYKGMLAVACALRNRGTLKGVYGLHAKRVVEHKYSDATEELAIRAWSEANVHDITNGATGWGNTKDGQEFAKTKWWKNCIIVYRHKDHFFYKEIA